MIIQRKHCIECFKEIPETRKKIYKKRGVKTCSKKCSVQRRSLKNSKDRAIYGDEL